MTIQQFFSAMNSRGYRINDAHKYVTVTHAAFPKARRLNSLGAGYTQDDIVSRISNKWTAKTADIPEQERIETVFPNDGIKTTDGKLELQGIYTWFSCGLQIVYNRPNTNRALQYMLNDELLKLDKIISETNLLTDNRIETSEQLEQFRSSTQAEMTELTDARRVLRNKLKAAARADDTAECEQLRSYIELASERIKKLHKDMAACESIAERTPRLESRMLQIEEATRLQREVRKGEQRRRCSRTDRANES